MGNHESDWYNSASYFSVSDSGGECGGIYFCASYKESRILMSNQFYHTLVVVAATELIPMPAPATTNEPWWSYNVGLLHFVGTNHLRRNQPANDYLWRLSPIFFRNELRARLPCGKQAVSVDRRGLEIRGSLGDSMDHLRLAQGDVSQLQLRIRQLRDFRYRFQ